MHNSAKIPDIYCVIKIVAMATFKFIMSAIGIWKTISPC